jgi:hypothetical protein
MADTLPKSVLIFGATGTIGTHITNSLTSALESGAITRLGIFTSPSTASTKTALIADLQSRGVEVFVGDVTSESDLRSVLSSPRSAQPLPTPDSTSSSTSSSAADKPAFDTVVSATGRSSITTQIPILTLAETLPHITQFYPSEYGTDIEFSATTSPGEPPHQLKLQVRKHIRENVRRLKVTYLVTGPYPEMWMAPPPPGDARIVGGFDVKKKEAVLMGDGEGKVGFTGMPE